MYDNECLKKSCMPVMTGTMTGRNLRISPIVTSNYDSLSSPRIPHLLSSESQWRLKELPF